MCAGEEVRALHPQSEPETQMLCWSVDVYFCISICTRPISDI